jgi:hypothetical protein
VLTDVDLPETASDREAIAGPFRHASPFDDR